MLAVLTLPAVPLAPGLMSQSRWFRVLGTAASQGGGGLGQHGGFQAGGEAEAGIRHSRQTPAECSVCGMRVRRPRGRQQHLAPSTAC